MASFTADRWTKPIPVPARVIESVDGGVRKCLPPGTRVHGISQSGASFWAQTARIDAVNAACEHTSFFIKVSQGDSGRKITESEFKSMSLLYDLVPSNIPEPIACGVYDDDDDDNNNTDPEGRFYFYLCRFVEMVRDPRPQDNMSPHERPGPRAFGALVARMHKLGAVAALPGATPPLFGSPFDTWGSRRPFCFPCSESWERCFTAGLDFEFENEADTHGRSDAAFERLRVDFMAKVVPRLLRPLETEGRRISPTLVHGDLWYGNCAVSVRTREPVLFDGAVLYAHNEYELGPWFCPRLKMQPYVEEYKKRFPPSEPQEDFEDRGKLYSVRFNLRSSSLYPNTLKRRQYAAETMKELLDKYPEGYDGYCRERGKRFVRK